MEIKIIKEKISKEELARITKDNYGDMIKVDADIESGILALGGEYHSEGQDLLVREEGANGQNIWGVNFYPFREPAKRIEYRALINLKSTLGVRDMEIKDIEMRQKIKSIINKLLLDDAEIISS